MCFWHLTNHSQKCSGHFFFVPVQMCQHLFCNRFRATYESVLGQIWKRSDWCWPECQKKENQICLVFFFYFATFDDAIIMMQWSTLNRERSWGVEEGKVLAESFLEDHIKAGRVCLSIQSRVEHLLTRMQNHRAFLGFMKPFESRDPLKLPLCLLFNRWVSCFKNSSAQCFQVWRIEVRREKDRRYESFHRCSDFQVGGCFH